MILKSILFISCFCLIWTNVNTFECKKNSTKQVKTYIIDLDKPGNERFIQPALDFKDEIAALVDAQK